jgi:hypothetical protein
MLSLPIPSTSQNFEASHLLFPSLQGRCRGGWSDFARPWPKSGRGTAEEEQDIACTQALMLLC